MLTRSSNRSVIVPSGAQSTFDLKLLPLVEEGDPSITANQLETITLLRFAVMMQRLGYMWPNANLASVWSLINIKTSYGDVLDGGLTLTFCRGGSVREVDFLWSQVDNQMTGWTREKGACARALLDSALTCKLTDYAYRMRHVIRSFTRILANDIVANAPAMSSALFSGSYLLPQAYALAELVPSLGIPDSMWSSYVGTYQGRSVFKKIPTFSAFRAEFNITTVWQNGHYDAILPSSPLPMSGGSLQLNTQIDISTVMPYVCSALGDHDYISSKPNYMIPPDVTFGGELSRDQVIAIMIGRGWDHATQSPVVFAHEAIYDEAVMCLAPSGYNAATGAFLDPVFMGHAGHSYHLYQRPLLECNSEARLLDIAKTIKSVVNGTSTNLSTILSRLGNPVEYDGPDTNISLILHDIAVNRIGSSGSHATVFSMLYNLAGLGEPADELPPVSDLVEVDLTKINALADYVRGPLFLFLQKLEALNKQELAALANQVGSAENLTAATVGSLAAEIAKGGK